MPAIFFLVCLLTSMLDFFESKIFSKENSHNGQLNDKTK